MVFTRRFLEKIFLLDEKSVLLVVISFFIKINLPLERIVMLVLLLERNERQKQCFFFSKSIIGSHYEELGII